MSKHKSLDFKTSAVKHYLSTNKSLEEVCQTYNCNKETFRHVLF